MALGIGTGVTDEGNFPMAVEAESSSLRESTPPTRRHGMVSS